MTVPTRRISFDPYDEINFRQSLAENTRFKKTYDVLGNGSFIAILRSATNLDKQRLILALRNSVAKPPFLASHLKLMMYLESLEQTGKKTTFKTLDTSLVRGYDITELLCPLDFMPEHVYNILQKTVQEFRVLIEDLAVKFCGVGASQLTDLVQRGKRILELDAQRGTKKNAE